MNKDKISIIGAYEHNLKHIDVIFYKYRFNIVTGLSGSGKSSLVFDTLYQKGQKVLLNSLITSGKYFLELNGAIKVKKIKNLSTVISISQKGIGKNSRSTLATMLGIYSYFRVLYTVYGEVFSPVTKEKITLYSINRVKELLYRLKSNNYSFCLSVFDKVSHKIKNYNMSTILSNKKYTQFLDIENLFETYINIDSYITEKDLEIIIEKIFSINTGFFVLKLSKTTYDKSQDLLSNFKYYSHQEEVFIPIVYKAKCLKSDFFIDRISSSLFSFNTKMGVCEACEGSGLTKVFSPSLIVSNKSLSINQNALSPWSILSQSFKDTLVSLSKHFNFSLDVPFKDLDDNVKKVLFYGSNEMIEFTYHINQGNNIKQKKIKSIFGGVILSLQEKLRKTDNTNIQDDIYRYMIDGKCSVCKGYRINTNAQTIKIAGKHIGEVLEMPLSDTISFIDNIKKIVHEDHIAILDEIKYKICKIQELGMSYLSLDRRTNTLSNGELQRLKLTNQLFSGLTDIIYVLDEPCVGLHDHDKEKIIHILNELKNAGNTIIAVEHDGNILSHADHIIDIGPYAGKRGGEVVATGTLQNIMNSEKSITGQYLSGKKVLARPYGRKNLSKLNKIGLYQASGFNLKNIDLEIYENAINVITGISGSGKSTLINKTLYSAIKNYIDPKNCEFSHSYKSSLNFDLIDRIIKIDQSAICRTPKSNPAIYIGLFTKIRDFFVELPVSKENKMTASMFSFNVTGGRCEYCKGDGYHKIDMHFLQDSFIECDVCKGQRYNSNTLKIKYKNKSIADILKMSAIDALEFFKDIPSIRFYIQILCDIGLDYIHLGQPANSLSGGESQRVKLAKELSNINMQNSLYIFDEPSTGLHIDDINKLIKIFDMLVENNNTVVIIEHNLNIISIADFIFDIGPDSGDKGGELVAQDTPENLAKNYNTHTAKSLKKFFNRKF